MSAEELKTPASPQPIDRLQPRVASFSSELRWTIAIAAKVAAMHILEGRFHLNVAHSQSSSLDDDEDLGSEREDEQRLRRIQDACIAAALRWLQVVCGHLEINLGSLPDNPTRVDAARLRILSDKQSDVAWELVLVSLGVEASYSAAKGREPAKDEPPLDYHALSRALLVRTASYLKIRDEIDKAEKTFAEILYFQMQKSEKGGKGGKGKESLDAAAKVEKEEAAKKGNALTWAATGAGFILGGVALGLTGGLAAPALAPLLAGTMGLSFFAGSGGAVLIGTLLGLGGGGLASYRTHRRLKGLDEVSFEPVKARDVPDVPSLTSTIVASGFLLDPADSVQPWRPTFEHSGLDVFALKADPQTFLEAGRALEKWVRNQAIRMGGTEIIKMTALNALYAGVALPLSVFNGLSTALDSDFSRCRDKAKKAGVILAEILEKKVQGSRPTILIGYGHGATMILEALLILNRKGLGDLVYEATLISLPSSPSEATWASARSVVSNRLVNCYSTNDWVLAIAARLYTLSPRVAGLQAVKAAGVDNVDVSDLVAGHLELRGVIEPILKRVAEGSSLVKTSRDAGP